MLRRISPIQFDRPVQSGRTNPAFITCQLPDGSLIEVVAKFSAGCELKETSLAMEMVAACLAGDLGLPIPEPFLVEVPAEWAALIPDIDYRRKVLGSSRVAFGSSLITGGFRAWSNETRITDSMLPIGAAIFAFDAMIQNPDRREGNPNCLVKGEELRIIDHEMAFSHRLLINWTPPWAFGGLKPLETPGAHIFRNGLRGRAIDYQPIQDAWLSVSNERLAEYGDALPGEWNAARPAVDAALKLIQQERNRFEACLAEVKRVLT